MFYAAPNFERTGVIAGFVLSPGYAYGTPEQGRTPGCARGVLFAQDVMYRPATAPTLPAAPASTRSWLFYNSSTGFYWAASFQPVTEGDAYVGWVVTTTDKIIALSSQLFGEPTAEQALQGGGQVEPRPTAEAPNQIPVTSGDNACRVVYSTRGTSTLWRFAGAVRFDTSSSDYGVLATIKVISRVTQGPGMGIERTEGYLTPPAALFGFQDVAWYSDEYPLPQGEDQIWTLEFRSLNADGIATPDPPQVTGLVVSHTTATVPSVGPAPNPDEFTVTNPGYDATLEKLVFPWSIRIPADRGNTYGYKIEIQTPLTVVTATGILLADGADANRCLNGTIYIERADCPVTPEQWTFRCVPYNANREANASGYLTQTITTDAPPGAVPDLLTPLLPTLVVGSEQSKMLLGANEPWSLIRVTVTMPANHRATRWMVWISKDGGSTWGPVTTQWASWTPSYNWYEWVERTPASTANWLVKVSTANVQATNLESAAVVSAPFSSTTTPPPAASGITDAHVGTITYGTTVDGVSFWGIDYVRWTNPTGATFFHSQLTVQRVDDSGNPSPNYEGEERIVTESIDAGVEYSYLVWGWTPPESGSPYHHYRFRLYVVNRNLDRVLQTTAWTGAAYLDVSPVEQSGALQLQRAAQTVLGASLSVGIPVSGGTAQLNVSNTNTSNVLPNGDFQITTGTWVDKWTAVNDATRQTSGMETGQYLVRLGYNASASAIVSERMRVSKGARYSASVRVKADATPGGSFTITFRFYTPSGSWLSTNDVSLDKSNVGTAWETIGHSADVPSGVDAYWMEVRLSATPTNGKYYYIDRAELSLVRVQQAQIDSNTATTVTLGVHLNASSQYTGISTRRSNGWGVEQRDNYIEIFAPSGRSVVKLYGFDGSPDFGVIEALTDEATPKVVTLTPGVACSVTDGASAQAGLAIVSSHGRIEVDGQQVVGVRQSHIVDPSGGTTVDTQARSAIISILAALEAHGLLASS